MAQRRQNIFQRLFASLFKKTAMKEPMQQVLSKEQKQAKHDHLVILLLTGLSGSDKPVLRTFRAPTDAMKFIEFYKSYQANGWHYEQAILPYKREQLRPFNLHRDAAGEYTYSIPQQHGGFHVHYSHEDNDKVENPLQK